MFAKPYQEAHESVVAQDQRKWESNCINWHSNDRLGYFAVAGLRMLHPNCPSEQRPL